MSQRHFRDSSRAGMIMLDIILALALSSVSISSLASAVLGGQAIFDRAQIRSDLIDLFEEKRGDFVGLMPYDVQVREYPLASSTELVQMRARGLWYGDDRIETVITAERRGVVVEFSQVRAYPFASVDEFIGTPFCSPARPAHTSLLAIMLPIDPLLPLTDIQVRNDIAYIAADSTKSADPDLLVFDIADPKNPRLLSSIHTGPGIASFTLAGNYIFAAAASSAVQLHVIRIESLSSLVLAATYRLPSPEVGVTPPYGSAVAYDRQLLYLGTEKWDGEELAIIDVSSPESPMKIGGLETSSRVNDIYIRDDRAYVAASDQYQLRVVDVSSSSAPYVVSSFDPSGWNRQEGKSVSHFEDSLGFSRVGGGFNIRSDHEVFYWATSSSLLVLPLDYSSLDVSGGVYGVIADRQRLYLATGAIDRELTIIDRSLATSSAQYYSLPVLPQTITCDRHKIYILARTAPAVYEIITTDP